MLNTDQVEKLLDLARSNECFSSKENKEMTVDTLLSIKHFYTLIQHENQKEKYLEKFIKKMKIKEFQQGQIIYEKGTQNQGLYIILKGQISLWDTKSQEEINNEMSLLNKMEKLSKQNAQSEEVKNKIQRVLVHLDLIRKKCDDDLLRNQEKDYFLTENICTLKRIKYADIGDSLNEEPVLSGAKTQLTAIAQREGVALYIGPSEYLEIFDLEINKLNFITEILLKNYTTAQPDSVRRLAYKFKEEVFPYGSIIFEQGDPANIFMIIKSGQVEMSKLISKEDQSQDLKKGKKATLSSSKKNIDSKNKNLANNNNNRRNDQQLEEEEQSTLAEYQKYYGSKEAVEDGEDEKQNNEEQQMQAVIEKIREEQKMEQGIAGKKRGKIISQMIKPESVLCPIKFVKKSQHIRLGIMSTGQILGLEDLMKHKIRSYQAQSVANDTLIYYITKKKIEEIINLNQDENLKKAIKDSAQLKNEWYGDVQERIGKFSLQPKNEDGNRQQNILQIKNDLKQEQELSFKAVVQKLFEDRRNKIITDFDRRNKSETQSIQELNEISYPQINDEKQKENKHIIKSSDKGGSHTIIKQNSSFLLSPNSLHSNKEQRSIEGGLEDSQKHQRSDANDQINLEQKTPYNLKLDQYENRFTTIFNKEKQFSLHSTPSLKSKREELLRNYKLETSELSLKQKLLFKIKSNQAIASKFKKYDAESSIGFLEAKKYVQRQRQTQKERDQTASMPSCLRGDKLGEVIQIIKATHQNISQDSTSILASKQNIDSINSWNDSQHKQCSLFNIIENVGCIPNKGNIHIQANNKSKTNHKTNSSNISFQEEEPISISQNNHHIPQLQNSPFPQIINSQILIHEDVTKQQKLPSYHLRDSSHSKSQIQISQFNMNYKHPQLNYRSNTKQELPPNWLIELQKSYQKNHQQSKKEQQLTTQKQQQLLSNNSAVPFASIQEISQNSTMVDAETVTIMEQMNQSASEQKLNKKYIDFNSLVLPNISNQINLSPTIRLPQKMLRKNIGQKFNSIFSLPSFQNSGLICISDRQIPIIIKQENGQKNSSRNSSTNHSLINPNFGKKGNLKSEVVNNNHTIQPLIQNSMTIVTPNIETKENPKIQKVVEWPRSVSLPKINQFNYQINIKYNSPSPSQ